MIPKLTNGRTQKQDRARRSRQKQAAYASVRQVVIARDGHACRACGRHHGTEVHHLTFRSQGGADSIENCLLLCAICHAAVHDRKLTLHATTDRGAIDPLRIDWSAPIRFTRPLSEVME